MSSFNEEKLVKQKCMFHVKQAILTTLKRIRLQEEIRKA